MTKSLIEVKEIQKTFKISEHSSGMISIIGNIIKPKYIYKKAVDGIDFSIKRGEMVGFIGPNGAGKSTTIKMLSGILYPDAGEINIDGYIPYKQRKEYVANIGVVFGQKTQLSWDLPLIDSLELLKYVYKIPEDRYKENIKRFSSLLDIDRFINQPVRQLSLGQRMRGDIVAALLHSPKIVFFDEPTIGLDVVAKEKIREFIKYLNKTEGITMIFTTHDMQDIESVCNRLIIIDKGKKIYDGGVKDIKNNYGTIRTVDVEFEEGTEIEGINNVRMLEIEGKNRSNKRFIFDSSKVRMNNVITELLSKYNINDVSIKEPDIDEIIRGIYEGSINVI